MKKDCTNGLMTSSFWRVCLANLMLHLSVFLCVPELVDIPKMTWRISSSDISLLFLAYALGFVCAGPFHSYLGDTFRRKNVFICSSLSMAAMIALGSMMYNDLTRTAVIAFAAGLCFSIAVTAAITVSIDITESSLRGKGNMVFAFSGCLGMLLGMVVGIVLSNVYPQVSLACVAVCVNIAGIIAISGVYVAFRAPIGVGLLNMDRFFLPLAWVPAINVLALAVVVGLLAKTCVWMSVGCMLLLVCGTAPLTKAFVELSHHCQRGTANTTCVTAMQLGFFSGASVACVMSNDLVATTMACCLLVVSVVMMVFITIPYMKEKRVRY